MKKSIIEAIGTMFLVLVICLTGDALSIGCVLMVMVYMGGHISGAHFNPAVSLAVMMRGKMKSSEMMQYWIAQIAGGLIGAGVSYWLKGEASPVAPPDGMDMIKVLGAEFIFTFALALVVLNVATSKDTANNSFYGLAIGFTVFAGAKAVGGISGGAFNPAVGIAPNVFAGNWSDIWLYIVAPLVGAALASIVFNMTSKADTE